MASKLQGAKEFLAEKQQAVTESGPLRMVKEKVGNLVPQGAGAYLSKCSPFPPPFPPSLECRAVEPSCMTLEGRIRSVAVIDILGYHLTLDVVRAKRVMPDIFPSLCVDSNGVIAKRQ